MKRCLTEQGAAEFIGSPDWTDIRKQLLSGAFYNEQFKQWFYDISELEEFKKRNNSYNEKILFHATTPKKVQNYHKTGHIIAPVRGFTTLLAATVWAMKTQRSVILKIKGCQCLCYKLPDHHNSFGEAWWFDMNIKNWKCIVSPEKF